MTIQTTSLPPTTTGFDLSRPSPDDLKKTLASLASRRPIFHTEADFQFELAWELRQHGWTEIRLERPVLDPRETEKARFIYLDIVATGPAGQTWVLELKYFNRKHHHTWQGEDFWLKQSAPDHGRLNFVRDIERIESLVTAGQFDRGAAIIVSNFPTVWSPPDSGRAAAFDDFRIHDGRTLGGNLRWTRKLKNETVYRVGLEGQYALSWSDYSHTAQAGCLFRQLIVPIPSSR